MKKLLSLLSVLTISGTAIPTTIAASPYQKKEHSTENLVRNKRNSNVLYPVTTMYTFNEDDGNHKKGDILFGTTNGIYLRKAGESTTTKINGIDKEISLIQIYPNNENYPANFGSAHVIALDGSIYYIRGGDNVVFPQNDVPYPVTTMYTFNEDDGNHKKGDILFGTTNGIYLRKAGESTITKINGIDKEISLIQIYPNNENYPANFGSAHVIALDGSIYYIRGGDNVVFPQNDVPYPVTTMYTFNEDDGNHKKGDILFGTTNGIYLRKAGESTTTKINEINESKKINNVFNVKKQIIKGLILNFKENNINSKIKKIENINYYLNFPDIEVTKIKDSNFIHVIDFEDVCFNPKNLINNSKIIKSFKIPKCSYNQKQKIKFQIIKGISKYGQESINSGWDLNYSDENKIIDFVNINNNKNIEIKHVLSDSFNSLNIDKQEKEIIINHYNEQEDYIQLAPNEKALIKYSIRKITSKSTLNLKQKINGWINAKIITENNEEKILSISLKEIMEILKKHNLLSIEISINNDNSVTFIGEAIVSKIREGKPKLILNTYF